MYTGLARSKFPTSESSGMCSVAPNELKFEVQIIQMMSNLFAFFSILSGGSYFSTCTNENVHSHSKSWGLLLWLSQINFFLIAVLMIYGHEYSYRTNSLIIIVNIAFLFYYHIEFLFILLHFYLFYFEDPHS